MIREKTYTKTDARRKNQTAGHIRVNGPDLLFLRSMKGHSPSRRGKGLLVFAPYRVRRR
jgi:hypothetical protein